MIRFLMILILCCRAGFSCWGQSYDSIGVGLMNTVHMVFDSPVLNYDLGSGSRIEVVDGKEVEVFDVIINKVGDRLKLAAAVEQFETTNLFVETEAAYYNFILSYKSQPKLTHYITLQHADHRKSAAAFEDGKKQTSQLELEKEKKQTLEAMVVADLAALVHSKPPQNPEVGEESQRIRYFLNGIFVRGDYLFFRVNFVNSGNVKFDLGYEGFFIKDKKNKGVKRSAKQTPEPLECLLIFNKNIKVIDNKKEVSKVYAFRKFTIEEKKVFTIEFWEDEGQRKVELRITPKMILDAKGI